MTKEITYVAIKRRFILKDWKTVTELAREFVIFSASTFAFQLSRLAVGLIVAAWVGPGNFGIWNALNLLLLYGSLVTLGVLNGMNRDVPLLVGSGKSKTAEQVVSTSFWFVLCTSGIGGLVVIVITLSGNLDPKYFQPLLWMGLLFTVWQIYQYLQFRLKSYIQFNLMSLQQFAFAIILPIVALPLSYEWGITGFIVGQTVATLVVCVFILTKLPLTSLSFRWSIVPLLIKTGFPIMAAGLVYSLLTTVDRWVILNFLGVEALGYYTLPILYFGVFGLLPSVIAQQMYPRMAAEYGRTKDKRALIPLIIWQSIAAMAVTLPVLVFIYLFSPYLVERFLSEYLPGLTPARILLLGLAFLPIAGGVGNFLNTVGKQGYYLAVQTGAVLVNLSLDVLFVKIGWGLPGVAWGATLSYVLYVIALVSIGIYVNRRNHPWNEKKFSL